MGHSPAVKPFVIQSLLAAGLMLATPAYAQVAAPPAPATQQASATSMRLQSLVEKVVRDSGIDATVAVYVTDADGSVAADMNGTRPVIPASNNKLITTAAALSLLGPDYTCVTRFYVTGPITDGVLQGDLIVYGGGDPSISGRYQKDKRDITAIMRHWADQLKAHGITKINGNIVADDSFFDDVYFHPNWYASERAEWYEAEVSALAFNDNCIDISWSAKDKVPGDKINYKIHPETGYVDFVSEVTAVAKGRSTERYYKRDATSNRIVATGTLNVDSTKLDSAAIHDGALFTVSVFRDVLKKQGIEVGGRPVKVRGAAASVPQSNNIFNYASPTLLTLCQTVNLNSQNFYTECVAKLLAKVRTGEGSYPAAMAVISDFYNQSGIYNVGHNPVDGSGLSNLNKVTGRQLVETLRYMDASALKQEWRSTLPQGHERGSLKGRFSGTDKSVAKRIYGKTGLIGGVRSLSGFVVDAAGREVYYSIVLNDLRGDNNGKAIPLIDKLAVELAKSK